MLQQNDKKNKKTEQEGTRRSKAFHPSVRSPLLCRDIFYPCLFTLCPYSPRIKSSHDCKMRFAHYELQQSSAPQV